MSSEPVLRLDRPLLAVRQGARPPRVRVKEMPPPAQDGRIAEREKDLHRREQGLSARENELANRENELARKEAECDAKLHQLADLINSARQEKAQMLESNEEEIVTFSLSITEKVLQYEIENGRYKIGEVVRSTLRAVRDKGALIVRVNPRDYELARAAVEQLSRQFGTTRINCVSDGSIPLASCCIETDSGKIFSEIPGRLERIERSLLKKNGDVDGV